MHGCVVGAESVLVVAIVDGDLDADTGIDESDDGGWDTNEVGVAAVGGTGKAGTYALAIQSEQQDEM